VTPTASIVPIAEAHIEGFRNALDSVARERRYLAMLEAPSPGAVRAFVLRNIESDAPQFVAVEDGEVVGWCDVLRRPQHALRHAGGLGIGVVAAYRGRGIGRRLLEAALRKAWQTGFSRVELTVRVDNPRARRLYERFGFVTEGLCRHHMRIDGEYYDSYLMALLHGAP
jgi:RimJ/RimL family protein N-acetyltransferase